MTFFKDKDGDDFGWAADKATSCDNLAATKCEGSPECKWVLNANDYKDDNKLLTCRDQFGCTGGKKCCLKLDDDPDFKTSCDSICIYDNSEAIACNPLHPDPCGITACESPIPESAVSKVLPDVYICRGTD
jgi:hypothetical protein